MYQNLNPSLRNSPAINHAAALAKASGASLHIAAFVRPLEILSLLDEGVQERGRESYLQDHRDWLKNQATNLHALGLEVTTEVTWADDMKQDACDLSGIYLTDMGGLALSDITKELRTTEEQSFIKLAGRYGVPSDRRHFILGHPVSALSDFANEQQVDVFVMGRVQYHGLEKLLGSTTEHILYQVPCSVLAV
ncbi:universal stress protein [Pseudomonas sp. NPDC087336]|uniref:universal stress protein n=1 Tax=Pseudomonas sp. NPDC087336 TaxID=3364436 RepID=UPI00381038C1